MTDPSIYVADLSAYTAGILRGKWITLDGLTTDPDDVAAVHDTILSVVLLPESEEWAIHEFEGFGPIRIGEHDSIESVLEHVERMGDDPAKYFAYCDAHGSHYVDNFDPDDVYGPYDSPADYAWEILEQVIGSADLGGWLESAGMPEDLRYGISFDPDAYVFALRCNTGISFGEYDGLFYVC